MDFEVGLRGYKELVVSERDLASFAGNVGVWMSLQPTGSFF